jgi:predicted nucleotidyltransferase
MLKLRDGAPLDSASHAIVRAVKQAATDTDMRVMLVGASARDIMLSHVHNVPLHRATADVDFAVAIHGWNAFDGMVVRLLDDPRFTVSPAIAHRLYYNAGPNGHGVPVDIVPFGPGVGGPRFRWPNDPDIEMNVTGYPDAAKAASIVDIGGVVIEVLSVPGLALLKLFAWNDRHAETRKDANDLATLLRNYSALVNADRLYEDPALLDDVGHDYMRGASRLLGRDVRHICSAGTLTAVQAMLTPANLEQLVLDAFAERLDRDGALDTFREQFDDFAGELNA